MWTKQANKPTYNIGGRCVIFEFFIPLTNMWGVFKFKTMPVTYSFLLPLWCLNLLKKVSTIFLYYTFEWNQANFAYKTSSLQPIILHCFPHCLPDSTTTPNPSCFEQEVFDFLFFSFTLLPFWNLITSRVFLTPESSSPSHECLPTSKFVAHSMEH